MLLHPDRYAPCKAGPRNGVVVHDSEGAEGMLPWGQMSSAQLVGLLQAKGDRPSPTRPGGSYGAGYQAVATETGGFITVADDTAGPYHAGGGINPNMWSICIPGRANQTRVQWLSDVSRFYIKGVAAYIVDRWRHDGGIWPLDFASGAQLRAARADQPGHPVGYTSHAQVTASKLTATDHSDPGPSFPWDVLALDIEALVRPTQPDPNPTPTPDPTPAIGGSRMYLIKNINNDPAVFLVVPAPELPQKRFRVHVDAKDFPKLDAAYGPLCFVADPNAYGDLL